MQAPFFGQCNTVWGAVRSHKARYPKANVYTGRSDFSARPHTHTHTHTHKCYLAAVRHAEGAFFHPAQPVLVWSIFHLVLAIGRSSSFPPHLARLDACGSTIHAYSGLQLACSRDSSQWLPARVELNCRCSRIAACKHKWMARPGWSRRRRGTQPAVLNLLQLIGGSEPNQLSSIVCSSFSTNLNNCAVQIRFVREKASIL